MQDSFDIGAGVKKTRSTSTLVSEVLTFYSAPNSLSNPKESEPFTGMGTVLGQNQSTDSGFAESLVDRGEDASAARPPKAHHVAPFTVPGNETLERDTIRRPSYQAHHSSAVHRQRSRTTGHSSRSSSILEATVVPKVPSRRPSVTQTDATPDHEIQKSSRRSSMSYTSQSAVGSRLRPMTTPRRRRIHPSEGTSGDPYLTHQRARQLFQSFGSTLGSEPTQANEYREPLIATATSPLPSIDRQSYDGDLSRSNAFYSESGSEGMSRNPTPRTIIDWTAPATRRREYEMIDRSSRGVRGLWRKMTPRWCRSSSRTSFFEGDEDDARSVRRYRLDISEESDAEKEEGSWVRERELRPSLFRSKTTWSCFSFEVGKKKQVS
ncbi:hypothetical protein MMC11_001061 [Xylographa trunciseda]|nr:hypothetical protein [Xylographa trunciseda]